MKGGELTPPVGSAAGRALAASLAKAPPLPPAFFLKATDVVARALLGQVLVVRSDGQLMAATIVETEAYLGDADAASHAFRGETKRNRSMFGVGGLCYVYLCYGMYYCVNVVTGPAGRGEAVLLRAVAPLYNFEAMARNRNVPLDAPPGVLRRVSNGPGKLTLALGLGLAHDGAAFDSPDLKLMAGAQKVTPTDIGVSPRIGISKAAELPLRFFLKDSPWVSR